MKCLLCDNDAVADGLCVPCGSLVWACNEWETNPDDARALRDAGWAALVSCLNGHPHAPKLDPLLEERSISLSASANAENRAEFMATFKAAKAAKADKDARERGCPECHRLVPRDEHKPACSRFSL